MRDYLFRGKQKDNGKWVYWNIYGEICTSKGRRTRLTRKTPYGEKYFYHIYEIKQLIDPETVGQYTGLTDKNGKKVFEGDVIQNKLFRFVIKYGAYIPSAYCKEIFKRETIGFYAFDGEREYQLGNYTKTLEVIGNIHDNPELMKGGEEE